MKQALAALLAGTIFGAGLVISGMTEPGNVVAFLNLSVDWSPALMLVMGSALAVAAVGYRLAGQRGAPIFEPMFHTPAAKQVDQRLLVGATLFGLGWGIAGFCPGPAIVGAFALDHRALVFVAAYLVGAYAFSWWDRRVTVRALVVDG
jgi:uncharacterized protein